jgi:hypothetical protein
MTVVCATTIDGMMIDMPTVAAKITDFIQISLVPGQLSTFCARLAQAALSAHGLQQKALAQSGQAAPSQLRESCRSCSSGFSREPR